MTYSREQKPYKITVEKRDYSFQPCIYPKGFAKIDSLNTPRCHIKKDVQ